MSPDGAIPLIDRELSWLEFDRRVLDLARRSDVPLLERVKFVAIAASNLDEFVMVRLGGLQRSAQRDGGRAQDHLDRVRSATRRLSAEIVGTFQGSLLPQLERQAVRFLSPDRIDADRFQRLIRIHRAQIRPALTPIAVELNQPFPILRSGTLNLAVRLRPERDEGSEATKSIIAVVQVPSGLPRFVDLDDASSSFDFVPIEDLIRRFLFETFPGHTILEASVFRVTRASDLDIVEEEAEDLLSTIEDELRRRDRGDPVRLEVGESTSWGLAEHLLKGLGLSAEHLIRCPGMMDLSRLWDIYRRVDTAVLREPEFRPTVPSRLRQAPSIFHSIREGDILLHHPYDSFRPVVDLLEQAADDPKVVAIKQTLYRTSGDSPIVRALTRAAERGKDVTALVELKARFDEANNIAWARALEQSGVHVVYGLIGLKTHCKVLLVTRQEDGLQRYLHLATGNYNPATAKAYTDLSLLTAHPEITHDAMLLFNVLTGYGELEDLRHLVVAPFDLRRDILERLKVEMDHVRAGRPAGLVAKMNSLVDPEVIGALYEGSQAGVPIDLMVRGICCLIPGRPGLSEGIRVHSILDRFLEHSRVFWWKNGGDDRLFSGSADWMPRNLDRRIEVLFPVLDPDAKRRVIEAMLPMEFRDNVFSWELGADGTYERRRPNGVEPFRAQAEFIREALDRNPEPGEGLKSPGRIARSYRKPEFVTRSPPRPRDRF